MAAVKSIAKKLNFKSIGKKLKQQSKTRTLFMNKVKKIIRLSPKKPPRMTTDEKRLVREMHFERNISQTDISKAIGRDLSCINRLLAQKKVPKRVGRPNRLTETQVDKIVKLLEDMVDGADATYEVSMDMIMKRSRTKASAKTVARRLHERGYQFRNLRHKPILTPEDIKDRYAFSKKYRRKPDSFWVVKIHAKADNHVFKVATNAKGRRLLSKRRVRGVYRKKGKSLRPGHVKPSPKLKLSTGAKGIMKTGAVGGGKVLVWHTIEGRWGGDAAADMYGNVMAKALRKRYPKAKSFTLLEDNDPSGNLSKKGVNAKAKAKIKVSRTHIETETHIRKQMCANLK